MGWVGGWYTGYNVWTSRPFSMRLAVSKSIPNDFSVTIKPDFVVWSVYRYYIQSIGGTSSGAGFERVGDGHHCRLLLHRYQLFNCVSASQVANTAILSGMK